MAIVIFSALLVSVSAQQEITIQGDITTDIYLTANNTYVLRDLVRVQSGATMYIEPGTFIFGGPNISDPATALIIKPGGKIMAEGTAQNPIVFTSPFAKAGSPQPPTYGDWAGIIILGNAPVNVPGGIAYIEGPGDSFGGNDPDDNSGILKYVRIEYTGFAYSLNNEINGLTMGGVGRGTIIEYIMVSYCGDDSFEWFGGTVNGRYLISHRAWDDDFDTDLGYNGKLQYLLCLRDPEVADQSQSNGFESDNDGAGSTNEPRTAPTYWNVTLVGPKFNESTTIHPLFRRGMHLRRSSLNKVSNAIIMGWPVGIRVDGVHTIQAAIDGNMWVNNSIISGWVSAALDTANSGGLNFNVNNWFTNSGGRTYTSNADVMLTNPYDLTNPSFIPMQGSPAWTGGGTPPNDGYFDPTATFVGAFGNVDWTAGWANWNPVNYVTSIEDGNGGLLTEYKLGQNYPNPFNPSTTITYAVPNTSHVRLSVYNILGQEIAVLVDREVTTGVYEVSFNADNLASGVYVYQLQAGNNVVNKKMNLMK